ncbi:hypothetical protein FFWV33_05365 [Flavobacterium faecale]|uniref:Secretion system C-terminal sorting domain-containing protein n=1 Tax=Flavobacterium faecale TaxID=1355330 RepID=A0A2S1LB81_9FLAO|nr:T9SS type A sorting domain-containing protein [Flavobacterium faecale]AWG21005.1 hypothetical protein FFWV33_05365 [Flavobacterium faecale]
MNNFTRALFLTTSLFTGAMGFCQMSITSQSTPAKLVQGKEVDLSITYTSAVPVEFQIQLFKTVGGEIDYANGSIDIYIGKFYTGTNPPTQIITTAGYPQLPATATPSTVTFHQYVDPTSIKNPVGTNYKWFVKISADPNTNTPGTDIAYGDNNIVTQIYPEGTVLGTAAFISPEEMYFDNSTKMLIIKETQSKKVSIYDLNGKEVKTVSLLNGKTVDLSSLTKGVYLLKTDDNKAMKIVR